MLYHDLKFGARNLIRNRTFSLINILGLSIGLACCIVIGLYAYASFLNMFDFPLIEGDKRSALIEPGTAVMSESTAKKYFGNINPIGKIVTTLNNIPVKITGITKDVPANSSLRFTMLISWAT